VNKRLATHNPGLSIVLLTSVHGSKDGSGLTEHFKKQAVSKGDGLFLF
jgi:hypothetical protein